MGHLTSSLAALERDPRPFIRNLIRSDVMASVAFVPVKETRQRRLFTLRNDAIFFTLTTSTWTLDIATDERSDAALGKVTLYKMFASSEGGSQPCRRRRARCTDSVQIIPLRQHVVL